MRIKTTILLLLLGITHCSYAQDRIYMVEASLPIEAIVIEISEFDVLYKTFDNPQWPDYRLPIARIGKIVFENGTERYFNNYERGVSPYPIPGHPYLSYRWGGIYDGYRRLRAGEVLDYFGYFEYGSNYLRAKREVIWGMSLTAAGAAALVYGATSFFVTKDFNTSSMKQQNVWRHPDMGTDFPQTGNIVWMGIGAVCLGVGIPLWVSGDKQMLRMLDHYNENRRRHNSEVSLHLGLTGNGGLGFSFNF